MTNRPIRADHVLLMYARMFNMRDVADKFVNQCNLDPAGECPECGWMCCPHRDPMHFHHDGCPSCAEDDD